jgi:hypothetical protein
MFSENVCIHCGACCAYFRVSFYWREADPSQAGSVPLEYVEEETEFYDNMRGTNQAHPYCAALSGKIGERVACTIYSRRPSPCREFGIQYKHGRNSISSEDLERCNKARAAWNLPPLAMESLNQVARDAEYPLKKVQLAKPHWSKLFSRNSRNPSGSAQTPSCSGGAGQARP